MPRRNSASVRNSALFKGFMSVMLTHINNTASHDKGFFNSFLEKRVHEMSIIPFDDRDGLIWLNGEMIPWRDAKTHTLTHGLHYASMVFEGERSYGGTIFKSREHTARLRNSCNLLDFDIPYIHFFLYLLH